ncbi:homocysteine S-methyltransferase YbgG-like [Lineus longissimus]|uniref:homocysteine S-methyltransferase YbgG-like n=1 Tax=Lineus longissimus TaxID=88925 RepID=UPI002B4D2A38
MTDSTQIDDTVEDEASSFWVLDGGMATELVRIGYESIANEPLWSSKLLQSDPDQAIKTVHRNFLEAGSDIIETNTYQANVNHLCKCLDVTGEEAVTLLKKGVSFALEARDEFWEANKLEDKVAGRRKPLVAGSVGPYGACLMDGSEYTGCYIDNVTEEYLIDWHRPHLQALVEAGVDIIALETIPAIAEGIALIKLLKEFPDTKVWLSFSCKDNGMTCRGECVSTIIEPVQASDQIIAIGCNCTAPDHVGDVLRKLQKLRGRKSLVVYANSGEEWTKEKKWSGKEDCKPLHDYIPEWVELGASWIGGCCRVFPDDIRRIRETLYKVHR